MNDTKPDAKISARIQRGRPPAAALEDGAASGASAGAERETAQAAPNTSAFTPAAVAMVARNPIAGSSQNAAATVPTTAPAVLTA